MLTEEWTTLFLLVSLCYIVYLQYIRDEQQETLESYNELFLQMAQELAELGSPNVTWSKPDAQG